jgi:hypothetical protein
MTVIKNILSEHGPMISKDLVTRLSVIESIGINTASQRLSREKDLERLAGFFKSNQSLIFLPEQQEDGEILKFLAKQMELHGKKYWYALNAVRFHSGTIGRSFLETYSSYPIVPLASHFTFDEIMRKFVEEKVLIANGEEYSFAPRLRFQGLNYFLSKTLEQIKLHVLDNFKEQSRNIGLVSYDSVSILDEYGGFRWSFKGVSPLKALKTGSKFGFVLGDILLGRPTRKKDVEFFIKKLEIVQMFKGAPKIMPILIIDNLDNEGFNYLKEKGIVIGLIDQLFGETYAKTLNDLVTILTNAAASLAKNPNKYLELIAELRKHSNGLLKNIKGALFEYVAGHYYVFKGASIEMGWEIYENNANHEMDVKASFSDKIIISECKGRISKVTVSDINNWAKHKVPAFRAWINKQEVHKYKDIEFEYWASSGYDDDAIKRISELHLEKKNKSLVFLGPNEIMQRAKEMRNKKLQKTLDNFFFKSNI